MSAAPDILEIVRPAPAARPTLTGFHRVLAQPGFWLGLCAARDRHDPHDGRLIASYERAAATLSAMSEAERATRDPASIPDVSDWLARRMSSRQRVA